MGDRWRPASPKQGMNVADLMSRHPLRKAVGAFADSLEAAVRWAWTRSTPMLPTGFDLAAGGMRRRSRIWRKVATVLIDCSTVDCKSGRTSAQAAERQKAFYGTLTHLSSRWYLAGPWRHVDLSWLADAEEAFRQSLSPCSTSNGQKGRALRRCPVQVRPRKICTNMILGVYNDRHLLRPFCAGRTNWGLVPVKKCCVVSHVVGVYAVNESPIALRPVLAPNSPADNGLYARIAAELMRSKPLVCPQQAARDGKRGYPMGSWPPLRFTLSLSRMKTATQGFLGHCCPRF